MSEELEKAKNESWSVAHDIKPSAKITISAEDLEEAIGFIETFGLRYLILPADGMIKATIKNPQWLYIYKYKHIEEVIMYLEGDKTHLLVTKEWIRLKLEGYAENVIEEEIDTYKKIFLKR